MKQHTVINGSNVICISDKLGKATVLEVTFIVKGITELN